MPREGCEHLCLMRGQVHDTYFMANDRIQQYETLADDRIQQ